MRTIYKMIGLTALAVAIQGCGGDAGPKLQPAPAPADARAVFNPALGGAGLPFPVDLLFSSTPDGSINVPGKPSSFNPANPGGTLMSSTAVPAAPFLADPQTALNNMDGFSTTAPMVVRFSSSIAGPANRTDIKDGVRIFRTAGFDPGAQGAVSVASELIWGVDFVAGVSGGTSLLIQPLKPLASSTSYIVVIEDDLLSQSGAGVAADSTYGLFKGAFLLSAAVTGTGGVSDFVLEQGGGSCNFSSPASIAVCTDVNTEDYQFAADNVPAATAGATAIAQALGQLEADGALSSIYQLEQLRRITAKHLAAVAAAPVPVDPVKVSLSYSVSTENIGGALAAAKAQVAGAGTAPSISVLNPIADWETNPAYPLTSPGPDGNISTPDYLAHIYLGTLDDIIQFVDPANQNTSVWKANRASWSVAGPCAGLPASTGPAGTENLVACNGFTPAPVESSHSVPVIISAPRAESLAGGGGGLPDCSGGNLPVVIYQHGITSNRGTLLAIADTLASRCIVGVAIDLPKHGILPQGDTFSGIGQLQAALSGGAFERLVKTENPMTVCQAMQGVDVGNATDFYCPSGDNFINLANLANARDTLRQGSVDLQSLYRAIVDNAAADLTAATIGTTVDTGRISFVGVSLGGIVGTSFVGQEPGLTAAVLNVSGGGIAKILDGSPSFEPSITAGLYNAAGLVKPSGDYEGYMIIAQTMVDNADPINFASTIVTNGTPVMMQAVMGNPSDNFSCILNGSNCPDQVVPNNTFGPSFGPAWGLVAQTGQTSFLANQNFITTPVALSGSDPLAQGTGFVVIGGAVQAGLLPVGSALGLGPLGGDTVAGAPVTFKGLALRTVTSCGATGGGVVRYTTGSHGSLLTPAGAQGPTQHLAVTQTMQGQVAGFVLSDGAVIPADANGVVFDPVVANASQAPCAP
jgi:dienelactone hydrolase